MYDNAIHDESKCEESKKEKFFSFSLLFAAAATAEWNIKSKGGFLSSKPESV